MCVVRFGVLWCGPTNYFVTPNLNYNWGGLWQQFIWCGDHIFKIVQRKICHLNIRRRPSTPKRANQCWLNTLFIHIGHLQCKMVWNFNINSTILYFLCSFLFLKKYQHNAVHCTATRPQLRLHWMFSNPYEQNGQYCSV